MRFPGFTYHYEQGRIQDTVYHIGARLDPSVNNVQDFAIVLFFELPSGDVVRVAEVDNTEHGEGRIHVHRNYREEGRDIRDFDVDITDWLRRRTTYASVPIEWYEHTSTITGKRRARAVIVEEITD